MMEIYSQLFWVFLQIGLFSFGGGYAAMPLIEKLVVQQYGWLSDTQFVDLLTIAESTPGPIALNAATFVGTQMAGLSGAIVATIANIIPSFIIVLILAALYVRYKELRFMEGIFNGLRPAVLALISSAAVTILLTTFFGQATYPIQWNTFNFPSFLIFIGSLLFLQKKELNPIILMLITGLLGLFIFYF